MEYMTLNELVINIGFIMTIIGAVSFILGPTHIDRFKVTTSAILGGGLAIIVIMYFTENPEAQKDATAKLAGAVIAGLVAFVKYLFSKKKR